MVQLDLSKFEPTQAQINLEIDKAGLRVLKYVAIAYAFYFSFRFFKYYGTDYTLISLAAAAIIAVSLALVYGISSKKINPLFSGPLSFLLAGLCALNGFTAYLELQSQTQLMLSLLAILTIPLGMLQIKYYMTLLIWVHLAYLYLILGSSTVMHSDYYFMLFAEFCISLVIFFARLYPLQRQIRLQLMNDAKAKVLEKSLNSKDVFLANITHELRTPLTGVIGMVDLLAQSKLDKEQQNIASIAKRSAKMLMALINDILDISKLAVGDLTLNRHLAVPQTTTLDVYNVLQTLAEEKGISLVINTPEKNKTYLYDDIRIGQILYNLIGNAIKFTQKGRIDINMTFMSEDGDQQFVLWEIKDTGPGIESDQKVKMFKRFEQLRSNKYEAAVHEGSGLGLAISKKLVELMDGTIGFRNRTQVQGSCFWFKIPLENYHHTEDSSPDESDILATQYFDQSLSILVAEDNAVNQFIIKKLLAKNNWDTTIVSNGQEAIDVLLRNRSYDVVLMDIMMPVINGRDAMRLIKQKQPNLPIIAITANSSHADIKSYLEDGFDGWIAKPIDEREFYKAIFTTLAK